MQTSSMTLRIVRYRNNRCKVLVYALWNMSIKVMTTRHKVAAIIPGRLPSVICASVVLFQFRSSILYNNTWEWKWHSKINDISFLGILRLTHANVWESMGKPCSCIQFIKVVFLLQVTRKSAGAVSERAMVRMIKSFKYQAIPEKLSFVALLLVLRTRNNTNSNKLVIFSGIASYYGDNLYYHHVHRHAVDTMLSVR